MSVPVTVARASSPVWLLEFRGRSLETPQRQECLCHRFQIHMNREYPR